MNIFRCKPCIFNVGLLYRFVILRLSKNEHEPAVYHMFLIYHTFISSYKFKREYSDHWLHVDTNDMICTVWSYRRCMNIQTRLSLSWRTFIFIYK